MAKTVLTCGCGDKKNSRKCCMCGCDCYFTPETKNMFLCRCLACHHRTQPNLNNTTIDYLKHLKNLKHAEPLIDNAPPSLKVDSILHCGMINKDYSRLRDITRENKDLLRRINIITRTKGAINTYNPAAGVRYSKIPAHILKLRQMEEENITMLKRLVNVEPTISNYSLEKGWLKNLHAIQIKSKNPLVLPGLVYKEFDVVEGVESLHRIPATFRQRVFIDLAIKNGRPMGRLIILLYSDLAPLTAQNFYDLCANYKNSKQCKSYDDGPVYNHFVGSPIHRVFPRLYAECGDIQCGNGMGGISADGGDFPEENFAMEHKYTGTLAMIPTVDGCVNSKFTISFKPLLVLNGKRVAFGRVIRGLNVLKLLEGAGTNFGKPRDVITITNCGTLPFISCRSCCTEGM